MKIIFQKTQASVFILIIILCAAFSSCDDIIGSKSAVTYTVTFNANGATGGTAPAEQTVNADTVIILPDKGNLTYTGNIFVGWNESSNGSGAKYSAGDSVTVTGNMVFYAQWVDSSTPQYTVTFNANGATGGAAPAPQTAYSGINITIPEQGTLVYSGKTFGGWNTQSNGAGTNYASGAQYTVTADVTLFAVWDLAEQPPDGLIEMVWVPGGSFEMGRNLGTGGGSDVTPLHKVTLSGFYMSGTEVTQEQYQAVMGTNPSRFSGNNLPVEQVSWYDTLVFCNKLSVMEGLTPVYRINGSTDPSAWGSVPASNNSTWNAVEIVSGSTGYRLPTEAQWEYAAKGGNGTPGNYTYAGSDIVDNVAWHSGNGGSRTHEVGTKTPNNLGLYDMSGNVWEWCWDWYGSYSSAVQTDPLGASSGSYRVRRGGSWSNLVEYVRSVYRHYNSVPSLQYNDIGFRLVRPDSSAAAAYTVTFDINGGTGTTPAAQTANSGTAITLPNGNGFSKTEYTFGGWNTNSSGTGTNYSADSSYTGTGDVTLYAKWISGTMAEYSADGILFMMAAVPGGITFPTGINDAGRATVARPYEIAETAVTWELWNTVRTWAVSNGYSMSAGQRGSNVNGSNQQPVTMMNWYDAVVWCNALTEYWNAKTGAALTTVYNNGGNPIRNAGTTSAFNGLTPGEDATGFRLPTSMEWELAARWRNDDTNTVAGFSNPWFTRGDSASGAAANVNNSSATGDVAVYNSSSTAAVKSKTPNSLGLYDMSGNAFEWCIDAPSSNSRTTRGGAHEHNVLVGVIGYVHSDPPNGAWNNHGFRIVRTDSSAATTYTVTFNINGGTGTTPAAQTANSGTAITLPDGNGFSKTECTFGGWNTNSSGTGTNYNTGAYYTVTGDVTLYAKWNIETSGGLIEMVFVPGGSFEMGSTSGESDERPVHTVTLTIGFYMGRTEVTQAQYQAVMGTNPSYYTTANGRPPATGETDGNCPVEWVSWYDALVFCNKLSITEGLTPAYRINNSTDPSAWGSVPTSSNATWNAVEFISGSTGYRLPTEAQWEYAAKGGNGSPGNYIYAGSNTVGDVAWYNGNSGSRTHEVETKAPNGLGVYDMSGNVWEWCWDWYGDYSSGAQNDPQGPSSGSNRVGRGGNWNYGADGVRSVDRSYYDPSGPNNSIGFRVVRP
jgi:uncharacterized repeat protein (TIGR02543 family)